MRTALTMLGMIIGERGHHVGGARCRRAELDRRSDSVGWHQHDSGVCWDFRQGGAWQGQGNASSLVPEDAEAITQLDGVCVCGRFQHTRSDRGRQPELELADPGHDVDLPLIRSWQTSVGAFFTSQDVAAAAKVAVLGSTVRDQLFGVGYDPVGEIIRVSSGGFGGNVQNQPFTVVGVMATKGQSGTGQDQDDVIYVPYTTVMKKIRGTTFLQQITVSATSAAETTRVADAIAALLRVHKLQPDDQDDFMVRTMDEIASVRRETTQTMTALLAGIAGVSLLVGGIGIMNIMLVSVTERTREIGLRMAIGAKGRDVLLQFLVEALVLSAFGGSIGIALGFALSRD